MARKKREIKTSLTSPVSRTPMLDALTADIKGVTRVTRPVVTAPSMGAYIPDSGPFPSPLTSSPYTGIVTAPPTLPPFDLYGGSGITLVREGSGIFFNCTVVYSAKIAIPLDREEVNESSNPDAFVQEEIEEFKERLISRRNKAEAAAAEAYQRVMLDEDFES